MFPPNPQVKILYETLEAEDDLSEYVSTERVKYEIHYIHLMYYLCPVVSNCCSYKHYSPNFRYNFLCFSFLLIWKSPDFQVTEVGRYGL